MSIELKIKVVNGTNETLTLVFERIENTSVLVLKQRIETQDPLRFPIGKQRLIFQGQILHNEKALSDYNIQNGMVIHLSVARGSTTTTTPPPTASRAPASTPAAPAPAAPTDVASILRGYLLQMRAIEPDYALALQTLLKICENIIQHPLEEKYRKLRIGNVALKTRLFDRVHGLDCIRLMGFQEGVEPDHLVLVPNAQLWDQLLVIKQILDEIIHHASDFRPQSTQMQEQMAQSHPMVTPNNPQMLAQAMQQVQTNPQLMNELRNALANPHEFMQQYGLASGSSPNTPAPVPATASGPSPSPASAPVAALEEAEFDEEEIACAIAHSLTEQQ